MNYYLDTSAFVKFFYLEENSDKITKLILDNSNEIYISDLVITEFYSAIYRRFRMGQISESNLSKLKKLFEEEVNNFNIENINSEILKGAKEIIFQVGDEFGIRTLDAIHLSCYKFISSSDWFFVSSDKPLINIAKKLNIKILEI